ncbi:MAG: hypothetical protein ACREKL_05650, partial [Chthoniobacterales bacterium]
LIEVREGQILSAVDHIGIPVMPHRSDCFFGTCKARTLAKTQKARRALPRIRRANTNCEVCNSLTGNEEILPKISNWRGNQPAQSKYS